MVMILELREWELQEKFVWSGMPTLLGSDLERGGTYESPLASSPSNPQG